jgi:ATP-dependent Clp protease adaptor protein ClpS
MRTIKHEPSSATNQQTQKELEHQLILYNDEIHSFDYVIDALIEVCNHTEQQAAQCTLLTHLKGKCDVKRGKFDTLKKMRKALVDRDLVAHIN